MATQKRVDQLTQYCDQWEQLVKRAVEQRCQWLTQKSEGLSAPNSAAFNDLMADLDETARRDRKALVSMRAYRCNS